MKYIQEFQSIIEPVITLEEYQRMKNWKHHGMNRYDHSVSVAYHTYRITKFLHLHYEEATRAAICHDFFTDEVKDRKIFQRFREHPKFAYQNASKYFTLTKREANMIQTHMFPITWIPPKYIEGWILDLVDDFCSVGERIASIFKKNA